MPDAPRRILIVRLSHLGDVVHALPLFHALRAAHPGAEIGWVVQPEFAGLLEGLPGLDRILRFDRRGGARAWARLRGETRAFAPDWAVDAQGNAKSAFATLLSGARRRSGMHRSDWREPLFASVLNDPAAPSGEPRAHAMDRMLALLRHVAPGGGSAIRTDLALSERELGLGRERADDYFPEPGAPAALLHLSSPGDVRSWPAQSFAALARELAGRGEQVLVISGPDEQAAGTRLELELRAVERVVHWVGQRGLRELAAFFAASAERGARLVCCDSGPMHLAAACGLPVVALAGPQDERRTGPWASPGSGVVHRSLRAASPPACAPCLARACDHPAGPVCMSGIEVAEVALALEHASCG